MKVLIKGDILEIVESAPVELAYLIEKLSWTSYSGNVESILKKDKRGYWTYANLLPEIIKRSKSALNIEVINPQALSPRTDVVYDANILPGVTLYPHQLMAIKKAVRGGRGILELPTGSGKTRCLLALIRHLKPKQTIIIVPTTYIAEMFYTDAIQCGFTEDEVGIMHGKRKELRPVIIAVANSMLTAIKKKGAFCDALRDCDLLTLDESHHSSSKSWKDIVFFSNSKYKIGLTATPYNNVDGDPLATYSDAMTLAVLGPTLCSVSSQYLVSQGMIAQTYCHYISMKGKRAFYPIGFTALHTKDIMNNYDRNNKIIETIRQARAFDLSVLVLVQRTEHARLLMERLKDEKVICKFEGATSLQFDELTGLIEEVPVTLTGAGSWTQRFEQKEWNIVIASAVLNEGVDISAIDFTILAGGGKSYRQSIQKRGRGSRRKKVGDNHAFIVDFIDRSHAYLYKHSLERRSQYAATGSIIVEDDKRFWRLVNSTVNSRKPGEE